MTKEEFNLKIGKIAEQEYDADTYREGMAFLKGTEAAYIILGGELDAERAKIDYLKGIAANLSEEAAHWKALYNDEIDFHKPIIDPDA